MPWRQESGLRLWVRLRAASLALLLGAGSVARAETQSARFYYVDEAAKFLGTAKGLHRACGGSRPLPQQIRDAEEAVRAKAASLSAGKREQAFADEKSNYEAVAHQPGVPFCSGYDNLMNELGRKIDALQGRKLRPELLPAPL